MRENIQRAQREGREDRTALWQELKVIEQRAVDVERRATEAREKVLERLGEMATRNDTREDLRTLEERIGRLIVRNGSQKVSAN